MFQPMLTLGLVVITSPAVAHIGDHSALTSKTLGLHLLEIEHVAAFFVTLTIAAAVHRARKHIVAKVRRQPEKRS